MKMKKKKMFIWLVIAVIVLGGGFYWYKKSQSGETSIRYITEAAEKGTLSSTIVVSGSIVVDSQESVDPTITGTIANLAVNVGDTVKKGDFLFNVINDDLDTSVAQAAASYQSALNSVSSAQNERLSAEASYRVAEKADDEDDDTYTKRQLKVLENKIDLADNSVLQAQKSLSASALSYQNVVDDASKRTVTSPIDGTIIDVSIKNGDELGSSSNSSSESAIIVGDLSTLKAEIPVNEVDITKVEVGQKVAITLDALEDVEFSGEVEKIDSIGTSSSGVVSYDVTVKFNELDDRIKPTMSVAAIITISEKEDVITVSSSAIKSGMNDESFVEVLENGMLKMVTVEVGDSNDTDTEITSGISEGDNVITQTIAGSSDDSSDDDSSDSSRSGSGMGGMGGMGGMMGGGPGGGGPPGN